MSFFDDTRDNIKVQNLEDKDRKDLFNKFVDAGGEVVKPKRKKPIIINREKQREIANKMDSHNSSIKSSQRRSSTVRSGKIPENIQSNKKPGILIQVIHGLRIKMALSMGGITDFSTTVFKMKFFEKYKSDYKSAILEMQLLYMDIFKKNPVLGNRIIDQLDKQKPLYFELIEMTADIFDKTLNGQMIDSYIAFPNEEFKVLDYRNPVLAFFKKIYPLYTFQDLIYMSFEKALVLQDKMDKNNDININAKKKKLRNNLYIIFNKYLNKLYWLFCKYHGYIIPTDQISKIDEILLIGPDLKPGNRVAAAPPSIDPGNIDKSVKQQNKTRDEEMQKARDDLKEKAIHKVPDHLKAGLRELRKLHMPSLFTKYAKPNDLARKRPLTDRILLTFLIFNEFDRELSFLLTTNKIKYNPITDKNQKSMNYRSIFESFFNKINPLYDAFKQYFTSCELLERAKVDRPVSKDQYFKFSKRINEAEKERHSRGINTRGLVHNYMDKLSSHINFVLKDMRNLNKIVSNSKDHLKFDTGVEENQRLNNKTILEAFEYLYSFVSAFAYKVSPMGDLAGELDIQEDEKEENPVSDNLEQNNDEELINDDITVEAHQDEYQENIKQIEDDDEDNDSGGSIMDELDDLL